ncbi:MAG: UvrD-helicase domain-containing protein [Odoribacteraceae bacterium]|jgi:ATP-dependent exoDNAse (exonuclease V) beta subunit|nr:UvrD-helicase domain-containing protein [Odoribacteraceae bacterium]
MPQATALTIYKASAGSGKTFALAMEFFKIIFASPPEYKNILAVTFTNKATGEMKSRVIRELHHMARGEDSPYKRAIAETLLLSDAQIKERATLLQTSILHDYGRVSVTTIDRFFQRLLKSFARELGVFPGYNVELDTDYVLARAVDQLVQRASTDKELGRWITELMEENVEATRAWNVKDKIADLGKELFGEHYKLFDKQTLERFGDKKFLAEYRRFLLEIITSHENALRETGDIACQAIEASGLQPADFKRGARGFISIFARVRENPPDAITDTTRATVDNLAEWTAKQQRPDIVARVEALYPTLNPLLARLIALHDDGNRDYRSALQLRGSLYQLGILDDLANEIREYCREKGVMLLGDTTHLLNLLIGNNDAPFIFEKCGNFYHHLMIDEFQDTSTLQWANFRPLVVNTLAEGGKALLVGDIKQSIYRWRDGDWQLLAGGIDREFATFGVCHVHLDRNWRSRQEIVEFNNLVFRGAARRLAEIFDEQSGAADTSIAAAYESLEQQPSRPPGGRVQVHFSPAGKREEESLDWIMQRATEVISDLTTRGASLKNCVILVRTAKEGALVADYLMQYNKNNPAATIPFVSNDSLFLTASPRVQLLVSILRHVAEPRDAVNRAAMLRHYFTLAREPGKETLHDILQLAARPETIRDTAPPLALAIDAARSPVGSILETVENIIANLQLPPDAGELPYLIALQEAIFDYEATNTNSIPLFLQWWEKEGDKRLLTTSEEVDALRVLTVHKSKGLEFDAVILPFCSWELDDTRHRRRLWANNREKGFRALATAPVAYSSRLKETHFNEDYRQEQAKTLVDNLNLLYVALTRAGDELHVFPHAPAITKEGKPTDVSALLYQVIEASADHPLLANWNGEERYLVIGQPAPVAPSPADPSSRLHLDDYPVYPVGDRVSVRYRYREFTPDQPAETPNAPLDASSNAPLNASSNAPLDEGKLLHELFRRVATRADAGRAVRSLCLEGLIPADSESAYLRLLEKHLSRPTASAWFDGTSRVINERDILLPTGHRLRPDRVMIRDGQVTVVDYKFGRSERSAHADQLRAYLQTLSLMDYRPAAAYLWYVTLDKIIRVE